VTLIAMKNLPKKAQREIEQLRAEVESWKAKALAATSDDPKATNVVIADYVEQDRGLPPNSIIVFRIGRHSIEVRHERDGAAIGIRNQGGLLIVRPAAANVIYVQPEE